MPGFGVEDRPVEFVELVSARSNPMDLTRKGPSHLRWSAGNRKTAKTATIVFDLPAFQTEIDGKKFKTCPGAGACVDYCLATGFLFMLDNKQANMRSNLLASRQPSFVAKAVADLKLIQKLRISFPKNEAFGIPAQTVVPDSYRIHASGDFYSQEYLDKWFEIIRHFPKLRFYAYTKSFHLNWKRKPKNFLRVQSFGSKHDHLINTKQHHAFIFKSLAEFKKVNKARRAKGLITYAYGSNEDLPSLPQSKVPTHIGLIGGVVLTKGRQLREHGETVFHAKAVEGRTHRNPPGGARSGYAFVKDGKLEWAFVVNQGYDWDAKDKISIEGLKDGLYRFKTEGAVYNAPTESYVFMYPDYKLVDPEEEIARLAEIVSRPIKFFKTDKPGIGGFQERETRARNLAKGARKKTEAFLRTLKSKFNFENPARRWSHKAKLKKEAKKKRWAEMGKDTECPVPGCHALRGERHWERCPYNPGVVHGYRMNPLVGGVPDEPGACED